MISASQARRRMTSGGRSVPSAVVPVVNIACSTVTRSRAGVPWVSGGRPVSSACWAVATRASHIRAPWSRGSRASTRRPRDRRSGSGQVSGSRAALIRAPSSAEPRPRIRTPPARSSVIERYRSRWAARSSRSQLGFESAVDGVGVDDLGDVPAGFGELGGVEVTGLADQDLLPATPHQVSGRQVCNGADDDVCLGRRDRPGQERLAGARERTAQRLGVLDPLLPLTVPQPAEVGQPVTGRPVVQLLLGEVAGVDLDHRTGFHHGGRGDQLLDQSDGLDQLLIRARRPQRLGQPTHRGDGVGQHRGG